MVGVPPPVSCESGPPSSAGRAACVLQRGDAVDDHAVTVVGVAPVQVSLAVCHKGVVVTPVQYFIEIKKDLYSKINCKIVSLEDVINEVSLLD